MNIQPQQSNPNPIHKKDVKIGGYYLVKVSDQVVPVRIVSEAVSYRGLFRGWNAINLKTKRDVLIRSASRLRRELPDASTAEEYLRR